MRNKTCWVPTKEFLPTIGEKVLIISKWGHVSDSVFANCSFDDTPLFRPDGLKPHEDVKWWMPMPTDGWHDIKKVQPKEGEAALTMGKYGNIFSGIWVRPVGSDKLSFKPFVWEVLFWREMPELPKGVELKF